MIMFKNIRGTLWAPVYMKKKTHKKSSIQQPAHSHICIAIPGSVVEVYVNVKAYAIKISTRSLSLF